MPFGDLNCRNIINAEAHPTRGASRQIGYRRVERKCLQLAGSQRSAIAADLANLKYKPEVESLLWHSGFAYFLVGIHYGYLVMSASIHMSAEKKKPQKRRNYQSISISVPPELEQPFNVAAAKLRMSRSQWLVWLGEQYLDQHKIPKNPEAPEIASGSVPPRVRRGRKPKK